MFKTAAILMAAAAALAAAPRTAQAQVRTFTCESYNNRQVACGVDTRGGVRLVEQLSSNSCVQGRTWGATRNAVWVSGGCRARFQVGTTTRNNGYGSGRYNNGYNNNNNNNGNGMYRVANGERLCEQAVASQFLLRRNTVSAALTNGSRNNPRYRWRAVGRTGTCRFDGNGNVSVTLDRSR
jgi:hypothetical protein